MTLTWLDVAALCGLIVMSQALVGLLFWRRLRGMERRLGGVIDRLGRAHEHLGEVHKELHETFGPLACGEVETKARTVPRQSGAGEWS